MKVKVKLIKAEAKITKLEKENSEIKAKYEA